MACSKNESFFGLISLLIKGVTAIRIVKYSLLILLFSAQSLVAGFERYGQLMVADASSKPAPSGSVRVMYLGTNGYQFEYGEHVLLLDPYFSRIGLSSVLFNAPIRPDWQRRLPNREPD
jgi:hypothetical protein